MALSSPELEGAALRAGFDLCGFARAEPIPAEVLGEWLAAGMDADMDWMRRRAAERLDVRTLLPSAQTVVSLACNYYFPDSGPPSPIARYARGRDYHATLRDRMRALRRFLAQAHPEVKTYGCVDSGPVMEKVWAARAGLGYVGKNGCLLTERFGSYVLLATLILDAEVDRYAAGPLEDRCGSCSACVNACPTQAIGAGGRVDARLCLSYQTIENAAEVPSPLRETLEGIVFGCDICQDVCPLNTRPLQAGDRFAPRAVAALGVRELAALSLEDYRRLVPGTPLARAKYDGLRRNALYAIGAAKDATGREVALRLMEDPSPPVAEAARWAVAQLDRARA